MATKAERFRSTTARQGQDKQDKQDKQDGGTKAAASKRQSRAKVLAQTAPPGERRYGGASTAARNVSLGKKALYKLEDTRAPQRPSRKSTRGSENRAKADAPLTSRQKLKLNSPAQKHDRGKSARTRP